VTEGSLTLVLTDDRRIHALNSEFRGKDRPTDVLAFPDHEDDGSGQPYLGDVIVSLERAVAQAPRFHNTPDAELARLVTHGILHILGYDHHTPADGRRMKAAERRALGGHVPGSLLPEEELLA
jgi:probable rRNA maturation factor